MSKPLQFLSDTFDLDHLREILSGVAPVSDAGEECRRRRYFDTFDWRLYAAGLALWAEDDAESDRLVLAHLVSGETVARALRTTEPGFAESLPAGAMRDILTPVLDVRRLIQVAEVELERKRYRLVDDMEKTVLWMAVERPVAGDARHPLSTRITFEPLRGYGEWADRVGAVVAAIEGLRPPDRDLLDQAAAICGRAAGGYTSKLNIPIDGTLLADEAVRRIHRALLEAVEANIEGTKADIDSEFLHDLRVAVRRARSAMSQIKGVLSTSVVGHFRDELGWVGQFTGPARDLDVYLLEYDKYRSSLPAAMREDLQPLKDFLIHHKTAEHRALCHELDSPRFAQLLGDWRYLYERSPEDADHGADAQTPAAQLAAKRIWRLYKRVRREGRAITADSAPAELHELRKSCKKLRYLIEFFKNIYPEDQVRPLVKALKRLLDNLGEYQDLEVHAEHLRDYAKQMRNEGGASVETLLAMGALVADLLRRQEAARKAFAKRFRRFDTKENRAAYERLFRSSESAA